MPHHTKTLAAALLAAAGLTALPGATTDATAQERITLGPSAPSAWPGSRRSAARMRNSAPRRRPRPATRPRNAPPRRGSTAKAR